MPRPRYYIPQSYSQHILRILGERGVDLGVLGILPILKANGHASDADADAVDFDEYKPFFSAIEALVDDPCLGLQIGAEVPLTAHRFLGYAIASSATLGDALNVAIKYLPILYNVLDLEFLRGSTEVSIRIHSVAELGDASNLLIDMTLSAITSLVHSFRTEHSAKLVNLTRPEPEYSQIYRDNLQCKVCFGAKHNEIFFDENILHQPSGTGDEASFQLALEQCELELELVQAQQSVGLEVTTLLKKHPEQKTSLEEIARKLKISPRTLRRRLHEENTNFQLLRKKAGTELACEYLSSTNWSVSSIAQRLGYENASSFGKAFKSWTGQTPRQYRDANPNLKN